MLQARQFPRHLGVSAGDIAVADIAVPDILAPAIAGFNIELPIDGIVSRIHEGANLSRRRGVGVVKPLVGWWEGRWVVAMALQTIARHAEMDVLPARAENVEFVTEIIFAEFRHAGWPIAERLGIERLEKMRTRAVLLLRWKCRASTIAQFLPRLTKPPHGPFRKRA